MNYYKATEKYLYNYRALKANIENIKTQIGELDYNSVKSASLGHISNGNRRKSTVESTVINLDERRSELNERKRKLRARIERIDRAIEALNGTEKYIIENWYFKGKQWWQIAHEVKYSERHCRRLKTNAVNKISVGLFGLPAMGEVDEATSQC